MATSLLLALVLMQGPTSAAQVDDAALALPSNPVPILARGIQVQSERAPAGVDYASAVPAAVRPAPCVYYTYIAGATYCSIRAMRSGMITGEARQDYLLWEVDQAIDREMEARARAAALSAERRRLEAQRTQPAPTRSAGTSSNFSGGMYTPAPRNSTAGATTRSSAPAKRGELQ